MKKFLLFLLLPLLFIINGCGGGGSDVSEYLPQKPAPEQMAKLDNLDNDEVAVSTYKAVIGAEDLQNLNVLGREVEAKKLPVKNFRVLSLNLINKRVTTKYCDSGSIDVNNISDTEAEVTYNNCLMDDTTYNGYAQVYKYSDGSAKVTLKNFTASRFNEKMSIKNGDFTVENNKFTIASLYATYNSEDENVKFLNYNMSLLDDDINGWLIVSVDGYISTDCTNGYVYVKTQPEVKMYRDYAQSIEGTVTISSNSEVITITFIKDDNGNMVQITDIYGDTTTLNLSDFRDLENSVVCN